MLPGRLTPRLVRPPRAADYGMAVALAAIAVAARMLLGRFCADIAPFVVLFPAIVLAGVFCGTGPGVLTALLGGLVIAVFGFGANLLAWPPFDRSQMDILLFLPAAATVLWATRAVRREAASAASAQARLAEVFRQFPGTAALLEAPSGRVLLRSARSGGVLGHDARALASADQLILYGARHPDGRSYEAGEYPIVRALRTGEVVRGERLTYHRDDGRIVHLDVHAGPIHDAAGNISASVGMAFDITEKVEAECRLIESEARHRAAAERLRAAVDAGALGLWEFDIASDRIRLDAAMAAMFGLPPGPAELSGDEYRQMIDPADRDRARDGFRRVIGGGQYADEYCIRTRQGETRWIISRGAILADLRVAVGVVGDITERRQRENALREALHARDVLMHEADHRIKNSLQLVVAMLRLQLARVPDAEAKQALAQAVTRVDAIANAHLSLQSSPDMSSIDIDSMLTELCHRVGSLSPTVSLTCDTAIHEMLHAEAAIPLGLLASELLTNALRHAYPAGAPGHVALTARVACGELRMTVADAGIGLQPGAFQPGLGTRVIGMLARQIGAEITRDSLPGKGTSITVRLPVPVIAPPMAMVSET
jgi:PAS domain S-box-containing protein